MRRRRRRVRYQSRKQFGSCRLSRSPSPKSWIGSQVGTGTFESRGALLPGRLWALVQAPRPGQKKVKRRSKEVQTNQKKVNIRSNEGQKKVKRRSNEGQTKVKRMSKEGQTKVKRRSREGQTKVTRRSNEGQKKVKRRSTEYQHKANSMPIPFMLVMVARKCLHTCGGTSDA